MKLNTYKYTDTAVYGFQFIHVKDCCFLLINHILCKAAVSLETELKFATFSQVVCVLIPVKMPIFHNVTDCFLNIINLSVIIILLVIFTFIILSCIYDVI